MQALNAYMAKDDLERRMASLRGNKRRLDNGSSDNDEEDNIPLAGRLRSMREASNPIRLGGTEDRPRFAKSTPDGGLTLYQCYTRHGELDAAWRDKVELSRGDVELLKTHALAVGTAYINQDLNYDLSLSNDVHVRVNNHRGNWTVNIRKVKDDQPTVPGLNLRVDEWAALVNVVDAWPWSLGMAR